MERPDRDVTLFEGLLAEGFKLNFSTAKINSMVALGKWLHTTSRRLDRNSHFPEYFSVKPIMENEYETIVYFNWNGITKEGNQMKGKTKHVCS